MIVVSEMAATAARPAPARISLTSAQLAVLRFIAGYIERHGYGPSFRDISQGTDHSSRGWIHRTLIDLEERGHLRRLPYRARAMEVLSDVLLPRAPDGVPCHFIPAKTIEARLEQLHPRGLA